MNDAVTHIMPPVTLRTLRRDDYPPLVELLRATWYADGAGPGVARRLAAIDFESCLARSNVARVACVAGRPVGVILGRVESDARAHAARRMPARGLANRHRRRALALMPGLLCSPEGWKGLAQMAGIAVVDAVLLHRVGRRYRAEVTLFLVDPAMRGRGVGRRLYADLMVRMRAAGVREYVLYTDTDCNVGFYERRGLTRRAEIAIRGGGHEGLSGSVVGVSNGAAGFGGGTPDGASGPAAGGGFADGGGSAGGITFYLYEGRPD